jgi:hypothetical protein
VPDVEPADGGMDARNGRDAGSDSSGTDVTGPLCDGGACGCSSSCASLSAKCGSPADPCSDDGGKLFCGNCPASETCTPKPGYHCTAGECQPLTCADYVDSGQCGMLTNGCDGSVDCSACPPGETCAGTRCCTPATVCPPGVCTYKDPCTGDMLNCVVCPGGSCEAGVCTCPTCDQDGGDGGGGPSCTCANVSQCSQISTVPSCAQNGGTEWMCDPNKTCVTSCTCTALGDNDYCCVP